MDYINCGFHALACAALKLKLNISKEMLCMLYVFTSSTLEQAAKNAIKHE